VPAVVLASPLAHEASDGRLAATAPSGTDGVRVEVGGHRVRPSTVQFTDAAGRVRLVIQLAVRTSRPVTIRVVALRGDAVAGSARVADVRLLGAHAFRVATSARVAPAASSRRAAALVRSAGFPAGVAVQCAASGVVVRGAAERSFTAASTLKAGIVAAALARDRGTVDAALYRIVRPAIVDSSNDAANAVLLRVGGGSAARGTARVNALFRAAGMPGTRLDGPYRTAGFPGAGPSRKVTTADDLRRLAYLLYRAAASGDGALAHAGLGRHDARLLLGLMLHATYPGLVRPVSAAGAVAHKAGWLAAIENDLAIAFGARGGPCFVGVTSSGASLATATRFTRRALPTLLALARR
jgi:beta-lactamase class A